IPLQTIAPKFTGRFNKGVDYEGDIRSFEREFEADLMVIGHAIKEFGLPENLKISVHSGSDKFSLYPVIGRLIKKHNSGIHIKTAGTTWLEEAIGLAESGGEGLEFVKEIYLKSLDRIDELSAPYADVIDIKVSALPSAEEVTKWTGKEFSGALSHIPGCSSYNKGMRQLMHIAYKLAAERKTIFYSLLEAEKEAIALNVTSNIFNRHICRLFDITP
ncbi:MAG TPA: tagaturonate epimerase family protein, partial [Bacteroidales bacterium]|nr:tagaturonate epimerase family protein [Bacteroidales bacterium]